MLPRGYVAFTRKTILLGHSNHFPFSSCFHTYYIACCVVLDDEREGVNFDPNNYP